MGIKCSHRNRNCIYRPSRRGGPRYKGESSKESSDADVNHTALSQLSPMSGLGSEPQQLNGTPTFTNSDNRHKFDRGLESINALLSPIPLQPDLAMDPNFTWGSNSMESLGNPNGHLLRIYVSETEMQGHKYSLAVVALYSLTWMVELTHTMCIFIIICRCCLPRTLHQTVMLSQGSSDRP